MITAIEIENFKGIGNRVRIKLRPLTLLFGSNSAGKSTIIQALQYAYELLERQNPDADRTALGGDRVDLGGFRSFVHGRDLRREVKLRFELDLSHVDLCSLFPVRLRPRMSPETLGMTRPTDLLRAGKDVRSGWVGLAVAWDKRTSCPYISEYEVGLDGERFGRIRMHIPATPAKKVFVNTLNLLHPVLPWSPEAKLGVFEKHRYCCGSWGIPRGDSEGLIYFDRTDSDQKICDDEIDRPGCDDESNPVYRIAPRTEFLRDSLRLVPGRIGLPVETNWDEEGEVAPGSYARIGKRLSDGALAVHSICMPIRYWPKEEVDQYLRFLSPVSAHEWNAFVPFRGQNRVIPDANDRPEIEFDDLEGNPKSNENQRRIQFLSDLLGRLLWGPGQILREELRLLRCVGPLRDTPPRLYDAPHSKQPSRWSNGLAAWDTLQDCSKQTLRDLNAWLFKKDRLDTGYKIDRRRFYQVEAGGELMNRLRKGPPIDARDVAEQIKNLPPRTEIDLIDRNGVRLASPDVGEGVRQVLPVLVAALTPTSTDKEGIRGLVTLEQPELHLHPRQQAALGDVLIGGALGESKNQVIVETHSEHLILRILRRVRESSAGANPTDLCVSPSDVGIWHVGRQEGGSVPVSIPIDSQGEFTCPWPDEFFEQDFNERFA